MFKRRMMVIGGLIAIVVSMTAVSSNASMITYNGTVAPTQVGGSLVTTLPLFDGSMGTLTGVSITMDLTVTPYAQIFNGTSTNRIFTSADWVSLSYQPLDIWTVTHASDGWTLAAPTVTTGTIWGTGQVVPPFNILTFVGSNSAPVNVAVSALSANLAEYLGTGSLTLGISGPGDTLCGGPFFSNGGFGGGGGNLVGTASVTYTYIPEPATMGLLLLGGLAVLRSRK